MVICWMVEAAPAGDLLESCCDWNAEQPVRPKTRAVTYKDTRVIDFI